MDKTIYMKAVKFQSVVGSILGKYFRIEQKCPDTNDYDFMTSNGIGIEGD